MITFWEFLSSQQWSYLGSVVAVLGLWYLVLLGMAARRGDDLRQEFFTAVFLLGLAEVLFLAVVFSAHLFGAFDSLVWLAPVHTFVVLPVAFFVLGVAAASSPHRRFRTWAAAVFVAHLLFALLMLWLSRGQLRFLFPEALLVLLLLPLFVHWWWRSLALLEGVRKGATLVLRLLLLALMVLAFAHPEVVRENDELAVIFVIDRSASMPRDFMPHWYEEYVDEKLDLAEDYMRERGFDKFSYGVVLFAGEAVPTKRVDREAAIQRLLPAYLNPSVTDLAAAVRQALALFPRDARKRIVLVSDGNENRGDLLADLQLAQHYDVTIDVVPVELDVDLDVRIDRLEIPGEVRINERIEPRLVIHSTHETTARLNVYFNDEPQGMPPEVRAEYERLNDRLQRLLRTDGMTIEEARENREQIAEVEARIEKIMQEHALHEIDLKPGYNFPVLPPRRLSEPGFYELRVEVHPPPGEDSIPENNVGSAFTVVRGHNRILFVHGTEPERAQHYLSEVRTLFARQFGEGEEAPNIIEVEARNMPRELAEWRLYDCVILNDVPAHVWREDQQRNLLAAINRFGVGLLKLGGGQSYGAGGYSDQPIVEALPVRMELEEQEYMPRGALVLVLHTCEFEQWNRRTKEMAQAAADALSDQDEFGIVILDWSGPQAGFGWAVPFGQVGGRRQEIRQQIEACVPGDMKDFTPAFQLAYPTLMESSAARRHCVVISDGDPAWDQGTMDLVRRSYTDFGITTTGIVVVPHVERDKQTMMLLARNGGDEESWRERYYDVTDSTLDQLPQIFTQEAARIRDTAINEGQFHAALVSPTEYLDGLVQGGVVGPPLGGYVRVTPKVYGAGETTVTLAAQEVDGADTPDPLLAHWQFGQGRVACWMSDVTTPGWLEPWRGWEGYRQFWGNLISWVARRGRVDDDGVQLQASLRDGRGEVVIEAYDELGRPQLLRDLHTTVLDPRTDESTLQLELTEPGRYEASFDAPMQGAYQLHATYQVDGETRTLTGGISVPYSREFRDLETDRVLLAEVARRSGGVLVDTDRVGVAALMGFDEASPEFILEGTYDRVLDPATEEPIDPYTREPVEAPLAYNPFADNLEVARTYTPIWQHFLVVALLVLLIDVFFRKVFVSWTELTNTVAPVFAKLPLARRIFREPEEVPVSELERLHSVRAGLAERERRERERRGKAMAEAMRGLEEGALPEPKKVAVEEDRKANKRGGKGEDAEFLARIRERAKQAAKAPSESPSSPSEPGAATPRAAQRAAEKRESKTKPEDEGGLLGRLRDVKKGALDDKKDRS